MNTLITKAIITLLLFQTSVAKTDFLLSDGFVASGYDVVSYFNNNPKPGNNTFIAEYEQGKFKFSTAENLKLFKTDPKKYIPKYGGWCAYAIGLNGKKVTVDPTSFRIYKNQLFLFYKTKHQDTLTYWLRDEDKLYHQAEINWQKNR